MACIARITSAAPEDEYNSPVVTCVSNDGQRHHCAADVSAGVALRRPTGTGACLLGRSWGYDDKGVWVTEGCGGEFLLGRSSHAAQPPQSPSIADSGTRADGSADADATVPDEGASPAASAEAPEPSVKRKPSREPERPTWGVLDTTGQGIVLHSSDRGEVALSAYALVRYIDQRPAEQSFVDHLGAVREIDTRRDVQFHRAMVHLKGWFYSPKMRYQITTWTVMSTDQTTLYGYLGYQFHKKFNLYGGINTLGGSRSVMGSHPFWLANDRVMADEFFRGSFAGSIWANGEILPGLWYQAAIANNLSQLGITARQLSRDIGHGVGLWWMPTTHEFGPNGSYSDWEYHEQLATRLGFSNIHSRETRQELENQSPENTQVRLADSLLLFETGSLAPGITVQEADWESTSIDLGFKYRGVFLQTELYRRRLHNFLADGPVPVQSITDKGFYVQGAFFPMKKRLEVYGATSWIYGDKSAGFGNSHEYLIGANLYPFNTRNSRVNFQIIDVHRSAVSSVFGFYVGGQTGTTYSVATSLLF
ncbi:MAG: DUF3011 domain-containing protein [Steroidobacteraceae bacterium]|nr:DUF3011 domain-containing protein [Steroidobacteraceae bacterium]